MAHRFWGLSEIVGVVAENLVSDKTVASAVALACCSRSIKEPALREVWRNLSSLAPLVKSFPPEVWELDKNLLCFKRAPLHAEWARFQQQYAPQVRHLNVSYPENEISLAALHLLQYLADCSPLLPNLVSLSWLSRDSIYIPLIFISRSLTSIDIDMTNMTTPMLPLLLTKLSMLSPYIRDIQLEIDEASRDPSMAEASSQLLTHCNPNCLRRYNVGAPTSASALRHAIQLPFLETFWLIFNTSMCQLPDPLPTVVFPSLQTLVVEHNDGDPTWLNLLPAIKSPVLSRISVHCSSPDVVQFIEKFHSTMTGCSMHERLKAFELWGREGFKITPHMIACIFPFKNLTELTVSSACSDVCHTSDLADDDIDLLTNALPYLKSLILGDDPCWVHSKITFKSLYNISHRCTWLTALQIHFNPTSLAATIDADAEAWDVALGLPGLNFPLSGLCFVKTLNVGSIWMPEEYNTAINSVALGLVRVFPHLENIEYNSTRRIDPNWEGVKNLIKVWAASRHGLETHNVITKL